MNRNKKDVLRFLLLAIPLSVPFYLLNLIPVQLFPFGMPTSVLTIIVPFGLAVYGVGKNGCCVLLSLSLSKENNMLDLNNKK